MTAAAPSISIPAADCTGEVSLIRLYVLRATYLLLVVGLGATIAPGIVHHEASARGVISSLLGAVCVLALIGLRYPMQMLPLLMFELVWKTIWLTAYGFPQWSTGHYPLTFTEDFRAIVAGVILMPIVIPWGYVYRRYVKQQGNRWC